MPTNLIRQKGAVFWVCSKRFRWLDCLLHCQQENLDCFPLGFEHLLQDAFHSQLQKQAEVLIG